MRKNFSDLNKQVNCSMSQLEPLKNGKLLEKSIVLELKEDTEDSLLMKSSNLKNQINGNPNQQFDSMKNNKNQLSMLECPHTRKKKTWRDKLDYSKLNFQITKLSQTSDLVLTGEEKDLIPLSIQRSKEISNLLWLPTEIDCVDSVLSSSRESSENTQMGKSWFSIQKKHPQKKNSLMTSFQSLQYSLPESMDSVQTQSKRKLNKQESKKETKKETEKKNLKTIKIRIFPDKNEKSKLQDMFNQYKWYYNATLSIVHQHYGDKLTEPLKYSNITIRKLIKKYNYIESEQEDKKERYFEYDETRNEMPNPNFWDYNHNRVPRGAIEKFVSSLNSCISNYKNGNIKKFKMKFLSKKNPTEMVHFEDISYPSFIKNIKSNYWYKNNEGRRKRISFSDIEIEKGLEIIHDKIKDRYIIHYPVPNNWYPQDDIRCESQTKYESKGDRLISLDPGVRKFLVGYDPSGNMLFFGDKASLVLSALLREIDKKYSYKKWLKIKNLVSELHWKCISYLISNYNIIILPDFRISGMIRKTKIPKITKRLLCMYSFYKFKTRLETKCKQYNKKLIIVDESYTSCTCTGCFQIKKLKGEEKYECDNCELVIDRDVNGSRNILIKNIIINKAS